MNESEDIMIKTVSITSLKSKYNEKFTGATIHHNYYIICQPSRNKILEYRLNGDKCKETPSIIPYSSISSIGKNQLIATCINDDKHLFLINEAFEKKDVIKLKIPSYYQANLNSIYYENECDKIYITTNHCIYSTTPCGDFIASEISCEATKTLLGDTNNNISMELNDCGCPILVCNHEGTQNYYTSTALICGHKLVAYTKNHSAYIAQISCNGNIITNDYIDENIIIHSIFMVDHQLCFMVSDNDGCNYLYESNFQDTIDHDDCDYIETENCYEQSNGPSDIIESIALIEAAISHILNAEGEKIQKVVALAKDTCELIEVNKSVDHLIKNITFLELVLYQKLELAKQCSETECDYE